MDSPDEEGYGEAGAGGAGQDAAEATEDEKEFAQCLEQIRAEEGVKRFADTFTRLYDCYFLLKEQLDTRKEEINTLEIKMTYVREAELSRDQQLAEAAKTIDNQRAEIESVKAMCDAMHARELASVETVDTLRRQLNKLEKEVEARKRAGAEEDAGATSAAKEKEKFEKEKARLTAELEGVRARLQNALSFQEELERKNSNADLTIHQMQEALEEAENNAVRTNRLVDHLKNETNTLKVEIETRGHNMAAQADKLNRLEKALDRRERQLKDSAAKLEATQRSAEAAQARAAALQDSLSAARADLDQVRQTLTDTAKELKNRSDECTRLRNELTKVSKAALAQAKRFQLMEANKASVENERDRLRQALAVMEREISLGKKQSEADRRDIENLNREKDILNKNIQKIQADAAENLQMIGLQEQRRKKLEREIETNTVMIGKQRLIIRSLEKDKDRFLEEAIALNEKIDDLSEEVRLRTADLTETQKTLREERLQARRLTAALDSTRAERNMLHKNYTEALDEIQDLKQKLKMLAYQIEQLKEDISGKEVGLKSCEAALGKCGKRTECLRAEVQSGLAKLCDARADVQALKQEEARLHRIVQEGDTARQKLTKQLEGLMNERDVIGAQLVRRNDEITLLYEKIRILEVTLHRGEKQYEQRVEDIRLLRLEIIRLRKEKNLLAKGIENMTDLRLEVFNLERELGRERLRVRALEEAMETPLNVHRWRQLAGTAPDTVQLAHKLRLLQKKVLSQSESIVLQDRHLKETENLYSAVKDTLALQPSPDIQQQLTRTQRALTQRSTELKGLVIACRKVLSQSETIVLQDRHLKETENLYSAVKDTLALQPSPDIQQQLTRTQRALTQRSTKLKCLVIACRKVLSQSETIVLQDRHLKETENLYSAVKDTLALQPSPDIQQQLTRTQRALTQRSTKLKCLVIACRKVLSQSETIVLQDRHLKETENLYSAVKDTLALQPSPDIQQQLTRTQRALTQRSTKLKCLVAELSMREKQVAEFRLEIAKLEKELQSFKSKYFEIKRALDVEEQRRLRTSPHSAPPSAHG